MKPVRDYAKALERAMEMAAEAIAAGTHSDRHDQVCGKCRQWAEMYHGLFDGTAICLRCAAEMGVPGADEVLRRELTQKRENR